MSVTTGLNNDLTDVAGLRVGQAEDETVDTGVTVVLCDRDYPAGVSVMGGGPGTRETDALSPDALVGRADAVVLSGGSVYGLAAASAVTDVLGAAGRGVRLKEASDVPPAPIVPAAILYDLANGGAKNWGATSPYDALGREALGAAGASLRQGRFGAGRGARAGTGPGGVGSASALLEDGVTVAALIAVNAFGSPFMSDGVTPWAWPFEMNGEFGGRRPDAAALDIASGWPADTKLAAGVGRASRENTTIGVVATDAHLTRAELTRLAAMATAGLARALRPVFAPMDGDILFALSTEARVIGDARAVDLCRIGSAGADCVARAVAKGCVAGAA